MKLNKINKLKTINYKNKLPTQGYIMFWSFLKPALKRIC